MPDVVTAHPHLLLGSRLKRLAEQMQTDLLALAHEAGVPIQPGQYPLLMTLEAAGPLSIGELAAAMRVRQPTVSRSVAGLLQAGWVDLSTDPQDRRRRTVQLTGQGQACLDRSRVAVWPWVEAAVREVVEELDGPWLEQICALEAKLAQESLSARAEQQRLRALRPMADRDLPEVVDLINRAYRGSGPDAGWNSETGHFDGPRTTQAHLRAELLGKPLGRMLVWRAGETIEACVWVEPAEEGLWRLSTLAVDSRRQAGGLGRQVLGAAEAWIRQQGGREIRLTVVNVRETLIAWYQRRGYRPTGKIEPFPYGDDRFGVPTRPDLAFVEFAKIL